VAQDGRAVFAAQCQVCHGDGHGTERGPNLADNRRVRAQTREELLAVIRDGIPASGMPAFNLSAAELGAVADFVRSLSAPAIDAAVQGNRAIGEQLFFSTAGCASCHMVFGRGKPVGPDLTSLGRQLTVDAIRQAIVNPSANIKKGYATVNLQLADGGHLRGFARNESRYNIQLQDLNGRFHFLSEGEYEIASRETRSLMPEGRCTGEECDHLVAYLSSLGGVDVDTEAYPFESRGGPTFGQVAHPQNGDWTTYHGAISGNRHSELDQINAANVHSLALKWVFPINHFVLELTPVVVDGVMYVTGPNQVFALDAREGRTIWHYQRPRSTDVRGDPAKGTNRGVAVLGDRVFAVTDNGRLLALHRVTGELVWETDLTAGLNKNNYGNTSAPLVVNDMVVAGISGGDLGVRGFLSAFKADTGEQVWRFWTVPAPGEPLSETWQGTALAEFGGGGGTWMTGTYDP
jgi:putative heme-binding domain-containing protein